MSTFEIPDRALPNEYENFPYFGENVQWPSYELTPETTINSVVERISNLAEINPDEDLAGFLMQRALFKAAEAATNKNYGIGAVLWDLENSELISEAGNQRRQKNDFDGFMPVAHAEIETIAKALTNLGKKKLFSRKIVLATTLEPCMICTGGIINTHINKVLIGAPDEGGGHMLDSPENLANDFHTIWKTHSIEWQIPDINPELLQLSWEIFAVTKNQVAHKLHDKTD